MLDTANPLATSGNATHKQPWDGYFEIDSKSLSMENIRATLSTIIILEKSTWALCLSGGVLGIHG